MELKTARFRGLETSWLDNGNVTKEALLFLHGFPDTPETWERQIEAFDSDFRILIPFGRGVGRSAAPEDHGRYSVRAIVLDHLDILEASCIGDAHVIGHDWGGVHAWMLASQVPSRVKTLAIINSVHPIQWLRRLLNPRQLAKSWYIAAFQLPFAERLICRFQKPLLGILSSQGWTPPSAGLENALLNPLNLYRQLRRDGISLMREGLECVNIPALVIASDHDAYLEPPRFEEFSDIASDVTIRTVSGKHWAFHQYPERVNPLLLEFWERGR